MKRLSERGLSCPFVTVTLVAVLGSAAFTLGCGADETDPQESHAAASQAIVAGNVVTYNHYSAAVYHKNGSSWSARPCTGSVVRRIGGTTWVLTARHCLVTGRDITSSVLPPSSVKVTTATNPGLATPSSAPGTEADYIIAHDAPANVTGNDVAIVVVNSHLELISPTRFSIDFSYPHDSLLDQKLRAYGYGRRYDTTDEGAGRLRWADGFSYFSYSDGFYSIANSGGAAALWRGDSGGMQALSVSFGGGTVHMQVGVNASVAKDDDGGPSSVAYAVATYGLGNWLFDVLGYFYLSPSSNPTANLEWVKDDNQVIASHSGDDMLRRWRYVGGTTNQKQIRPLTSSGRCLTANSSSNRVSVATCSEGNTYQLWITTAQRQLKNVGKSNIKADYCLLYANPVVVGSCSTSESRRWLWFPDY